MSKFLPKVLVLISTYNGEKYLKEQLNSLNAQKNVEVHFCIRDDGSSDDTINILREFQLNNDKVTLFVEPNIGCVNSFMKLLKSVSTQETKYDYYAFCDQDDVWLENKLAIAVSKLDKFERNSPALYFSHTQLVNEKLEKIISETRDLKCSFGESMVINGAVGCTMVFNEVLLKLTCQFDPKFILMHDGWVYRVCLATGGNVYFDKNSYILYRQHENNVVGGKSNFYIKWKRRINAYYTKQRNVRQSTAENLLLGFENEITKENKEILLRIKNYRNSFKSKILLIRSREVKTISREHNLMFKVSVLLGIY